ncbi:DUF4393 domain-containing protein [Pedococcus sp. 2YAF34]|uniref:DUF4393 domain-containing protein n=1 Tax=Pedococcus sp. 2YAF34 TaxID=3233032 RepID=UPI003F9B6992
MVTGGEAAAAKAAMAAGRQVLGEDASVKKQLAELAKDSPNMKRAAESYAKRIAIKQDLLLKLYEPLAKWTGVAQQYFETDFAEDMAVRVADIPDEAIVAPRTSVAVPAMQGLAYSLDEPDLKSMYLNLLAAASDARKPDAAHPSFAEIIKQLSAPEASHLTSILDLGQVPIVRFRRVDNSVEHPGDRYVQVHVVDLRSRSESAEPVELSQYAAWVDNWVRLGLVDVDYERYFTDPGQYAWVEGRPELKRLQEQHVAAGVTIEFDRGVCRVTDFGLTFAAAVR